VQITAIIPARYASTRFPGKPLADIHGKSMIQRVYERTCQATLVNRVIVATDDERIAANVRAFGGELCMTSAQHETGTDRLAEVAAGLDCDLVVNVQGDEPLINPAMIDLAVAPLIADERIAMGTLMVAIDDVEEFLNPNVVKVVTDMSGSALYFSRSPIPCSRDMLPLSIEHPMPCVAHKHIGLYVYRREFLLGYSALVVTPLEKLEKLEQLRALEHGYKIQVVETMQPSLGVDTPADLEKVRALVAKLEGLVVK